MKAVSVTPVGMKPARCRRDDGGRQFSDPPAAVPVDRIAILRPGIASRVALRLWIAGPGARPTGFGSGQFRHYQPVDGTPRDGWVYSL